MRIDKHSDFKHKSKTPSATADKTRNYNVQVVVGPPRVEGETLAQYIERTSEVKQGIWDEKTKTYLKPAGTVKQGRRPMFKPFDKIAHTPGPWEVQDLGTKDGYPDWHQFAIRDAKTNVHIATVGNVDRYFERNSEQHARLIAAAPELLKACKSAKSIIEQFDISKEEPYDEDMPIIAQLKAAISKAEGK